MNRFGRKKTMVILLTAIIISGFANRFAPNYPAFLIGLKKHEYGHITLKNLKTLMQTIISRSFSLCVHVPCLRDCHVCLDDGTLWRWVSSSFVLPSLWILNVFLLQVKSRLCLEPALITILGFGGWWPPWLPTSSLTGETCRLPQNRQLWNL